jgi:enediyne biosynthesis protein E4
MAALLSLAASAQSNPIQFTDVTAAAGIKFVHFKGNEGTSINREEFGPGVCVADFDGDGWQDIYFVNGRDLYNRGISVHNALYRNNQDGTFTDVTDKAGVPGTGYGLGCVWGDYDNDGFPDLFVTQYGRNVLYHNNGDGTFTDVTQKAGLEQPGRVWNSGATWIDYNRDGHLDLFVASYLDFEPDRIPKPGASAFCRYMDVPVNCGPRGLTPTGHTLYRNNGDGTFSDVTDASGVGSIKGRYAMTAVAADYDDDGWPDIYLACDSTPSVLLLNNHDGTFRDEALERGVALSQDGQEQAGMGVGIGDVDLDGCTDLFVTHFMNDTPALFSNQGKGWFEEVSLRAGLGVETRYVGWGAVIADFDNDGWPDLFVATGSIYPELEARHSEYPFRTPRVLYRNLRNGKFEELIEEAGPGISACHSSRGCAAGDFDNDGDLDLLIMNMNEPPSLLRNDTKSANHWLKVKLIGTKSNRSAIGSRVTAEYGGHKQLQEVTAQSSFYSVNDCRLHFGLGISSTVDLTVRWTNGRVDTFPQVAADRLIVIQEGAGITKSEKFKRRN